MGRSPFLLAALAMARLAHEHPLRQWLPAEARASWPDARLARLSARIDEARAAWPSFAVADASFVPFVVARAANANEDELLDALHVVDLYLACACAQGEAAAIAAFDARYLADVRSACARVRAATVDVDEVVQRVRQKLFAERPPAIASYAGRGALGGWLRVVTSREVLAASRRESKERPMERDFFEAIVAGDDGAELAFLKRSLGAELKAIVLAAFEDLSNRERSLLRYAYCDEKNVDEIAAVFRVHRATAARWVCAAREHLTEHTHEKLRERFGASRSEIGSIVRLGIGVIDTTFAKYLVARR
jgi:RNA polymerase sigma-70 factor (ECF subfamily)